MSAAEPAVPERAYVNGRDSSAVIDISKHRGRSAGARHTARGRWTTMSTPPGPHGGTPPSEPSALELFAGDMEISFNEIGSTLTDEDTAAVFLRTLDIWERSLQGSHAVGIINAEQLAELTMVIRGMREAPRLVG